MIPVPHHWFMRTVAVFGYLIVLQAAATYAAAVVDPYKRYEFGIETLPDMFIASAYTIPVQAFVAILIGWSVTNRRTRLTRREHTCICLLQLFNAFVIFSLGGVFGGGDSPWYPGIVVMIGVTTVGSVRVLRSIRNSPTSWVTISAVAIAAVLGALYRPFAGPYDTNPAFPILVVAAIPTAFVGVLELITIALNQYGYDQPLLHREAGDEFVED